MATADNPAALIAEDNTGAILPVPEVDCGIITARDETLVLIDQQQTAHGCGMAVQTTDLLAGLQFPDPNAGVPAVPQVHVLQKGG